MLRQMRSIPGALCLLIHHHIATPDLRLDAFDLSPHRTILRREGSSQLRTPFDQGFVNENVLRFTRRDIAEVHAAARRQRQSI